MAHKHLTRDADNYIYWSDRIIEVLLKLQQGYFDVIGTNAPVEGEEYTAAVGRN
jgi:hypothetical protein